MLGHNVWAVSEFYTCTAKNAQKMYCVRLLSRAPSYSSSSKSNDELGIVWALKITEVNKVTFSYQYSAW